MGDLWMQPKRYFYIVVWWTDS